MLFPLFKARLCWTKAHGPIVFLLISFLTDTTGYKI